MLQKVTRRLKHGPSETLNKSSYWMPGNFVQFQGTNEDRAKTILNFGVHMKDRNFCPLNYGKSLRGFKENSSSYNHTCVCERARVLPV